MIESTLHNIVGVAVLAIMLAHWFTPIQGIKNSIIRVFKFNATTYNALYTALNCSKCLSFWIGLVLFQDIITAALCSLIGFLINHIIDKVESWYE